MNILFHIIHGKWAISREYATSAHALVASILSEKQEWGAPKALISPLSGIEAATAARIGKYTRVSELPAGSIAVIAVEGPMTRADQACGPMGTASIAAMLSQAADAPNIEGIIMNYSTPGGQVLGTEALARAIEEARKKKPTYSMVDQACSAGYWCASAAQEVWLSGKSSEVGSIGVMCTLYDMRGAYEAEGIKVHHLYAKTSDEKNLSYRKAMDEGQFGMIEDELGGFDGIFMSEMKRYRPGIKESALKGATYLAEDAIKMGLADRIGTMAELAEHIRQQAKTKQFSNNTNRQMSIKNTLSGWLMTRFGITPASDASEEDIAKQAEEKLRQADALNESLQGQLTKANANLETARQQLEQASKERDEFKALAEKYGKKPGADATDAGLQKRTPDGADANKPSWFDPNAAHNREAAHILNLQLKK